MGTRALEAVDVIDIIELAGRFADGSSAVSFSFAANDDIGVGAAETAGVAAGLEMSYMEVVGEPMLNVNNPVLGSTATVRGHLALVLLARVIGLPAPSATGTEMLPPSLAAKDDIGVGAADTAGVAAGVDMSYSDVVGEPMKNVKRPVLGSTATGKEADDASAASLSASLSAILLSLLAKDDMGVCEFDLNEVAGVNAGDEMS